MWLDTSSRSKNSPPHGRLRRGGRPHFLHCGQRCLRCCGNPDNSLSIAVYSALGIFEGLVPEWPVEPAAEQRVWKKSIVRKELQAQLVLIDEIAALANYDADSIQELRSRIARQKVKLAPRPKPKGPPALTN